MVRRKGQPKERRGAHGETKLRGFQTWRRHVYDGEGNPQTIVIRVPESHQSIVFGWSVTSGFFEDLDEEGRANG